MTRLAGGGIIESLVVGGPTEEEVKPLTFAMWLAGCDINITCMRRSVYAGLASCQIGCYWAYKSGKKAINLCYAT